MHLLKELQIQNFAIIDELVINFQEGLTVLTGETGAGKSIIIDAVHLLAGGRASQDFVRHGEKKAELIGLFEIENEQHIVFEKLQEAGIDEEEGIIILQRTINDKGKSVCRINGKLVPLSVLREIGSCLIDIHGQNENQVLMNEKLHIQLLDFFAAKDLEIVKENYDKTFEQYRQLKKEVSSLNLDEQKTAQKIDLYQFQINELEQANLSVKEEETLLEERRRLMNFHKIFDRAQTAYEAISGELRGLDNLGDAMHALNEISDIDEQFKELYESVSSSFYILQDASFQIKNIIDDLEYDQDRLNQIEERLSLYQMMKRKYGATVHDILLYFEKIKKEYKQLLNRDEMLEKQEKKLHKLEQQLEHLAGELTKIRKKSALHLSELVINELKDLHMDKTKFVVNFESLNNFDENGKDYITFYISTNIGEPPKPLTKIASGGELSRIMLALKTIFSSSEGVTSIIFDEVDTGVSGRVAQAIAEKITAISIQSQVLCITHLPQVAAMADHHYVIRKEVEQNRTFTTVKPVDEELRIEEVSRMMSGERITELTLQHASELLNMAENKKEQLKKNYSTERQIFTSH